MKKLKYIWILGLAFVLGACEDKEVEVTPAVSFKEVAVSVTEGAESLNIPLELTAATSGQTVVYVAIKEGSVTGGREGTFCYLPNYVVLEKGAVRGNVKMIVVGNEYPNEDVSFELVITKVEGAAEAAGKKQSCKVTILDDDSKQKVNVGFDTVRMTVGENIGMLEVPVTVKGLLSDFLTFTVEAENGSAIGWKEGSADWDYKLESPVVRVMEGETWGVVNVLINDGKAAKEDRDFKLKITGVKGYNDSDTTVSIRLAFSQCDIGIQKVVRQLMFADTVISVNEALNKPVSLSVQLTAPVDRDIKVTIGPKEGATAIEDVNYRIASKVLTIKKGQTMATTSLTILDDKLGNPDRYCDFEILDVSPEMELAEPTVSRLVIENDDSSLGFTKTDLFALKGQKVILPVYMAGLHDKRVVLELKPVITGGVEELNHFMLLTKKVEIAAGDSIAAVEVQIMQPEDESFEFDIEIAKITVEGLSQEVIREEGKQLCHIAVGPLNARQLELKTMATVDYFSSDSHVGEAGVGVGTAEAMIDGQLNTYWHSAWAGGDKFQEDASKPFEIIYELDQAYLFVQAEIVLRNGRSEDCGGVSLFVSDDKKTWKPLVDILNFPKNITASQVSSGEIVCKQFEKGKFVRLLIKEGKRQRIAAVAEFRLWTKND